MVGLGAIGLGGLGNIELSVYTDIDGVDVISGADISPKARDLFESKFNAPAYEHHETMLDNHVDELDAVTIVTPHTLHYDQAMACLQRDIHVYVEKPLVTNIEHAVDLVETARNRGVVLQVGYQRHFHPAFAEIRRVVQDGRIGEIHAMNCHLGQDWVTPHEGTWRVNPALSGGGQLYDTGSHLLDAMLWTTGSDPGTVGAQMKFREPGIDVNSSLAMTVHRNGDTATASVSVSGDGVSIEPTEGYFFWGTEGRLSYTDERIKVAEKGAVTYSTEITQPTDFHTLTERKLGNFVASVRGEAEPAVPGEFGLQVTALTEAAYEAAADDCVVDVQERIEAVRTDRA